MKPVQKVMGDADTQKKDVDEIVLVGVQQLDKEYFKRSEELSMDLFHSTRKSVQKVMEDANMQKKDVDEIVLVEGKKVLSYF